MIGCMCATGHLRHKPRKEAGDASCIHECAKKLVANNILSVRTTRESKPHAVGIGAMERFAVAVVRPKAWCGLPGYRNVFLVVPRGSIEMETLELGELRTVDSPSCRGVSKGNGTSMIFPVHDVDDVDSLSLFVHELIDI